MPTIPETIALALAHHRSGHLHQAETLYRDVLAVDPRQATASHLLGVVQQQRGHLEQALGHFADAVANAPGSASFRNSLGEVQRLLGQRDQARASFVEALRLDDSLAAAHYNQASLAQETGDLETACAGFEKVLALAGNHPETHNNLGNLWLERQDDRRAEFHFKQALEARPNCVEALNNLGNLLHGRKQFYEAIVCFEEALKVDPNLPVVCYNLANTLRAINLTEPATKALRRAIELAPQMTLAHNNLGTLLFSIDDYAGAEEALTRTVELEPNFAEAHFNLGMARQRQNKGPSAETAYLRAIELKPDYAAAHYNLGTVLQSRQAWDEARARYEIALSFGDYAEPHCNLAGLHHATGDYDKAWTHVNEALRIKPDCAEAHYNRGVMLLGEGNFEAGWPEFEWERQCYRGPNFLRPEWDGAALEGRSIMVFCDHGLGDTLQFIRYLPEVWRRGAGRVVLAARRALLPLLREHAPQAVLTDNAALKPHVDASLEHDVQVRLMSLPGVFKTTLATIPADVPYLQADAARVKQWRERLSRYDGFRVGINWQGNSAYGWDHLRSIRLEHFAPLAEVPGVRLIVLQQGEGREQLESFAARDALVDLGDNLDRDSGAFLETAAILKNLDLLITSDTAIAHLAGGLAVPVWLALSFAPEWRWGRKGDTSPWYPGMRLFRQTTAGDWPAVFAALADALAEQAARRQALGASR